jgi:hypothetical protein
MYSDHRPLQLLEVWTDECSKWFAPETLQVNVFTSVETFLEDTNINTVTTWIVSESNVRDGSRFHELVKSPLFKTFDIISLFADEAHGAWKSLTSWRSGLFRQVASKARFTVLLSGTPFPLGPSEDGFPLLHHFGGTFDEDGKWPVKVARAFDRLFNHKPSVWQTLSFRCLLAPFCLRRTTSSTHQGEFIIPPSIALPMASIVPPVEDDKSEEVARSLVRLLLPKLAKRNTTRGRKLTDQQRMERADIQRFLAWTPMYVQVFEETHGLENQRAVHIATERIIKDNFATAPVTGRLQRLMRLLRYIKSVDQKFIIVVERLFLGSLAFYVLTPTSCD